MPRIPSHLRQRRHEDEDLTMKQFAFFFRQSRRLSEFEQKQRTTEVVAWVQRQISDGRKLEPRILGGESQVVDSKEKPASAASADIRSDLVAIKASSWIPHSWRSVTPDKLRILCRNSL